MLNFTKLFLGMAFVGGGAFANFPMVDIDEFYNKNPAVWIENLKNACTIGKQELSAVLQKIKAAEQEIEATKQEIEAAEQREKIAEQELEAAKQEIAKLKAMLGK